jgi:uncharacterized protein YlxP (DUF503 family)
LHEVGSETSSRRLGHLALQCLVEAVSNLLEIRQVVHDVSGSVGHTFAVSVVIGLQDFVPAAAEAVPVADCTDASETRHTIARPRG